MQLKRAALPAEKLIIKRNADFIDELNLPVRRFLRRHLSIKDIVRLNQRYFLPLIEIKAAYLKLIAGCFFDRQETLALGIQLGKLNELLDWLEAFVNKKFPQNCRQEVLANYYRLPLRYWSGYAEKYLRSIESCLFEKHQQFSRDFPANDPQRIEYVKLFNDFIKESDNYFNGKALCRVLKNHPTRAVDLYLRF